MSSPRCPCPVFCMYLSVEACLSPSLPFAVFALRLVGCDNVCCSSLVLSITAGSGRFPAVNSQSIYVPFGLVNSKKKKKKKKLQRPTEGAPTFLEDTAGVYRCSKHYQAAHAPHKKLKAAATAAAVSNRASLHLPMGEPLGSSAFSTI